jgi:hypothetical protein
LDNPLLNGYTVAYLAKTMFGVDRKSFLFFAQKHFWAVSQVSELRKYSTLQTMISIGLCKVLSEDFSHCKTIKNAPYCGWDCLIALYAA